MHGDAARRLRQFFRNNGRHIFRPRQGEDPALLGAAGRIRRILRREGQGVLRGFVSREWLEGNEEIAVKFVRASIKGWKDAIADPEEAVDIVMDAVEEGSTTRGHQATMMQEVAKLVKPEGFPDDQILFTREDRFRLTADIALQFGVITKPADIEAAYTNAYVEKALEGM